MAMGQDPEMVRAIVSAVKAAVDVPVIPKLTPNVDRIEDIGQAALEAGADGLCAINTVDQATPKATATQYSATVWAVCQEGRSTDSAQMYSCAKVHHRQRHRLVAAFDGRRRVLPRMRGPQSLWDQHSAVWTRKT